MSGPLIVYLDDSSIKTVTGTIDYDRTNNGALLLPRGTAFPGSPVTDEVFYRTDQETLYRWDGAAWQPIAATAAPHAANHVSGGSDELDGDLVDIDFVPTNYTGGTTLADHLAGINTALGVAPVFGTEYNYAESLGVTTTTGTGFTNKVTLNVTVPAGDYRLDVCYGWNHDSTGNDFEARVQEDGGNIGEIHKQEPQDSSGGAAFPPTGSSQRHLASRFYVRTLAAGSYTYTLDFRTDVGGVESSMWDARLLFYRVA